MEEAFRPKTLREAEIIIKATGAVPIAGGTDLMVRHRRRGGLTPRFDHPLIFLAHLEELSTVKTDAKNIRVGSCCTYSTLLADERVPAVLRLCIRNIASPAIRNRGTVGGNVCNASPAGDTLPILYALGSLVVLSSTDGERSFPIEEFITGPGTTVRKDDEILTEIIVPKQLLPISFYRKVGTRRYNSLSKVSFVGLANREGQTVTDIRAAFGAAAPTVVRSRAVEEQMEGKTIGEIQTILPTVCERYSRLLSPIDDQRSTKRYREAVAVKLLCLFLEQYISKS
jgi:xanthine dehydrogenase FAD-binding subunit